MKANIYLFIILLNVMLAGKTLAQSDVMSNVRSALKAGSSKELTKHFNEMVELNLNGDKSSYSKTQAEFVLKDFFKNHPPTDFQYIHQGASKGNLLKYAIGKYTYGNGSFRVLILFKNSDGQYYADSIDFTKE